jgi:cell shape-determining protein MreC
MTKRDLTPVENLPGFVKDPVSRGVLNTNVSDFNSYKAQRNHYKEKNQEMQDMKNELSDLKHLIKQLLDKG